VGSFFSLLAWLLPNPAATGTGTGSGTTGCDFALPSGLTVSRTLIVLLPQWGTTTDLPMDSYMVYTMPTMSSFVILPWCPSRS